MVMADLPGLIEGASRGKGLGDKFLRHIERTRLIAHVIDFSAEMPPSESYRIIRNEIKLYSSALVRKPEIIIAHKMDLPQARENLVKYRKSLPRRLVPVSGVTRLGLRELVKELFRRLG